MNSPCGFIKSLYVNTKQVKITMEGGTVLHGKGLESNDNFTQYRILQPSGEILLDDNQNETYGENE